MKKSRLLLSTKLLPIKLIVLVALLSTQFLVEKYEASKSPCIDELIVKADGEKLDLLMSTWFEEFRRHQDLGSVIYRADRMAVAATIRISKFPNATFKL